MKMNQPRRRSTARVELESCVTLTLSELLGHEPVGLAAAGIDPAAMLLGLLGGEGPEEFFAADPATVFPEAAKRKVAEDEDEDDDDSEDEDEAAEEEEEEEEVEEEEEADEDEEEDEEEEEEEEEEDEFDDPDDDDDFDDDDDEDDFDDDE